MNDRDRKKAGQDGIAVACRLHPELTRAELAEAAARYHFGDTVEAGEAGLPEIYERLQGSKMPETGLDKSAWLDYSKNRPDGRKTVSG